MIEIWGTLHLFHERDENNTGVCCDKATCTRTLFRAPRLTSLASCVPAEKHTQLAWIASPEGH